MEEQNKQTDNSNTSAAQTENSTSKVDIKNELSQVKENPKYTTLIVISIITIASIVLYYLFIPGTRNNTQPNTESTEQIGIVQDVDLPPVPTLPDLPELKAPQAVLPSNSEDGKGETKQTENLPELPSQRLDPGRAGTIALPETTLPPPANIPTKSNEEEKQKQEARRKSSIMLIGGAVPPAKPPSNEVVQIKSTEYMLSRGKVINAVLETAINSDFGGEVRAIVSGDVYSDSGKVILIPKGSKIFGSYSTGINGSHGRIDIAWDRVDLPNGYRLKLTSYSVDDLGRKGVQGRVDNKYVERISNVIFMTAIEVVLADTLDKIVKPPESTQTSAGFNEAARAIQTGTSAAFQDATKTYADICTIIQTSIKDKTSDSYNKAVTECTAIGADASLNADQKKAKAFDLANNIASSLLLTSSQSATPTKAQTAAQEGFKNLQDTLKDIFGKDKFTPTITVNQGKPIKIYVNRDYEFPKTIVIKKRVIK